MKRPRPEGADSGSVAGVPEQHLRRMLEQLHRLRESVRAFETTHPTLTGAIGRLADALAAMGI